MAIPNDFFSESKEPKIRNQDTIFFVEGIDDCWFLGSLFVQMDLDPDKNLIISVEGQDNFEASLKLFCKSAPYKTGNIKSIALLRDADDNFSNKLSRTQVIFSMLHWPQITNGQVHVAEKKFGFFIFPADNQNGDLETLCLRTVEGSDLGALSARTIDDAQSIAGPLDHLAKRQSQTFLTLSPGKLCRGVGKGFSNGRFDSNHAALEPIRSFISDMVS